MLRYLPRTVDIEVADTGSATPAVAYESGLVQPGAWSASSETSGPR